MRTRLALCLLMGLAPLHSAVAQSEEMTNSKDRKAKVLQRITVVESQESDLAETGSARLIDGEELDRELKGVDDIHDVLRQVPGVNIQDEEGYGLRPNIGFRGVPNERSSKITLMEDSILIAPAPYSAPSAYYFPLVGRMDGVEVVKGAGQLEYGPYTTGGALNLKTAEIPDESTVEADLAAGNDNTKKIRARVGDSWKYGGVQLDTYQLETDGFKDLDGGGDTGFDVEDYNLKVRLNSDPDAAFYQEVTYKFGIYDQVSNETYLGLTREDFAQDPFRRYSASQRDRMDADHVQNHIRHYVEFNDAIDLTTLAYHNKTQRNWYKLQSVGGTGLSSVLDRPEDFSQELGWLRGEDSDDGALSVRANQREYESQGIQSILGVKFATGALSHKVKTSARFHNDEEDRFQHEDEYTMQNGTMVLAERGAPGSQANRVGSANAWSFFIEDVITWDRLTVAPALRYERINYTRKDYGKEDPSRSGVDLKRNDSNVDSLIPGVLVSYDLTDELEGFVGVHKGFSPQGPASSSDVKEEESVNYELGARYSKNSLRTELVGFYADYDNLLGADTLSSGGEGTGNLFNAGEVEVYGVEASASYDLVEQAELSFKVPFRLAYTYTSSEFKNDFDSDFFGEVNSGDTLPYVPEHQVFVGLGLEFERFSIYGDANFVDSMETAAGSKEGRTPKTDSHVVFDLLAKYSLQENVALFASIDNLFDREYVVAQRPAGARPGLPLTALAGLEFRY